MRQTARIILTHSASFEVFSPGNLRNFQHPAYAFALLDFRCKRDTVRHELNVSRSSNRIAFSGLYLYILVVKTFTGESIKLRIYAMIGWGKFDILRIPEAYRYDFCIHGHTLAG